MNSNWGFPMRDFVVCTKKQRPNIFVKVSKSSDIIWYYRILSKFILKCKNSIRSNFNWLCLYFLKCFILIHPNWYSVKGSYNWVGGAIDALGAKSTFHWRQWRWCQWCQWLSEWIIWNSNGAKWRGDLPMWPIQLSSVKIWLGVQILWPPHNDVNGGWVWFLIA